jgi:diphosphomevalonate decarboxylase
MQITCKAPVNIAVIKYWGKRHVALNLPTNGSISVTIDMDSMASVTSITSDASVPEDTIVLNGQCIPLNPKFVAVLTTVSSVRSFIW